jgi:O-antigen ligase
MFFNALLISIFSDVCKIQLLFPPLASIQFQKVMVIIPIVGVFLNPQLLSNIKRGLSTPHGKALIFLSIWMVLSVPFSVYPGGSFRFLTEHYWKLLVTVCLIVAYGSSIEALDKMVWAIIFAVSVFTVNAYLSGGSGRFSMVESYDPNENALLFVLSLPFVFWKLIGLKGWKKLLMIVMGFLIVIGIIETGSRGGFLGLVAVIIVTMFQYRRVKKASLIKLLLIVALIVMVIYVRGGNDYIERITSIFDTERNYNYAADTGRITIWKQGISMMIDNPLLGIGVNQFMGAQGMTYRAEGGKWQVAHNSFIQVGAELGFPGLIAFCFIIFSTMKKLQRVSSVHDISIGELNSVSTTSRSLIGSWTGFIVSGSFLSVAYSNLVFLLFGLTFAVLNLVTSSLGKEESEVILKAVKDDLHSVDIAHDQFKV